MKTLDFGASKHANNNNFAPLMIFTLVILLEGSESCVSVTPEAYDFEIARICS
jgi:hypothetical protein